MGGWEVAGPTYNSSAMIDVEVHNAKVYERVRLRSSTMERMAVPCMGY